MRESDDFIPIKKKPNTILEKPAKDDDEIPQTKYEKPNVILEKPAKVDDELPKMKVILKKPRGGILSNLREDDDEIIRFKKRFKDTGEPSIKNSKRKMNKKPPPL